MRRPLWCRAFLVLLETETNGEIKRAAERAGVSRTSVYYRMGVDAAFFRDVEEVYRKLEQRHLERCLSVSQPTLPAA